MNQQTLQYGYTTGRYVWLVIALALALALGTQTAVARECRQETPLPAEVRLIAPGPEVPETVARFAGAWIGAWKDQGGSEALCHTLVIAEVRPNGYARVIYSHGTYAGWNTRQPNFWRVTGRIVDGALRFHLPVPERPNLAYRFAGETLQGTFKGEGSVSMTRVVDVSQVGCSPQAGGLPPAPPAAGPRARLTADELLAPASTGPGPVHNDYFNACWPERSGLARLQGDGDSWGLIHVQRQPCLCWPGNDSIWLRGRLLHAWRTLRVGARRSPAL